MGGRELGLGEAAAAEGAALAEAETVSGPGCSGSAEVEAGGGVASAVEATGAEVADDDNEALFEEGVAGPSSCAHTVPSPEPSPPIGPQHRCRNCMHGRQSAVPTNSSVRAVAASEPSQGTLYMRQVRASLIASTADATSADSDEPQAARMRCVLAPHSSDSDRAISRSMRLEVCCAGRPGPDASSRNANAEPRLRPSQKGLPAGTVEASRARGARSSRPPRACRCRCCSACASPLASSEAARAAATSLMRCPWCRWSRGSASSAGTLAPRARFVAASSAFADARSALTLLVSSNTL